MIQISPTVFNMCFAAVAGEFARGLSRRNSGLPIRALAYTSQVAPGLGMDELDHLARDAARFNLQAGVTGVLLFDGVRFLQYIEGPEDGVSVVYARVLTATSHFDLRGIAQGPVAGRCCPYWSMRWVPADQSDIDFISLGDWSGFGRGNADAPSTGVDRLAKILRPQINAGSLSR